jgi:sulfate permease, SulP family
MVEIVQPEMGKRPSPAAWRLFVPKLFTVLREGYGFKDFRSDAIAGVTVAIVALPLAMALAIASGATPDKGLLTAVIAGFLISALGGSRFQIGGPTGAFVVVVFNVIQQHGYDGLVLATLMAGLFLIIAGIARFGTWIKYIPGPVVTGFTAGIAVIIFSSQVKDLLGLSIDKVPAGFVEQWEALWRARDTVNVSALLVTASALCVIIGLRRFAPKLPAFLIVVVAASVAVYALHLPLETIGSKFGGISSSLPMPSMPAITLAKLRDLLPSAFTIAFLAGVESLLSAVVADGMTGRRHRSNCELVAQGVANIASAFFGGMPATGAIARTATNIKSGARSPVAGMLHAAFVLLFMLLLAPLAVFVPLASLGAVLVIVAWNMSEIHKFRRLMHSPLGDRIVLLLTFGLTVLVDLTVAIEVGVVLAAILFMHRMAEVVSMQQGVQFIEEDIDDFDFPRTDYTQRIALPEGVEVFQLRGPLFFGSAGRLMDALDNIVIPPHVFILRMRDVPLIDATGAAALGDFVERCRSRKIAVIASGVRPSLKAVLSSMGFNGDHMKFSDNFDAALKLAQCMINP